MLRKSYAPRSVLPMAHKLARAITTLIIAADLVGILIIANPARPAARAVTIRPDVTTASQAPAFDLRFALGDPATAAKTPPACRADVAGWYGSGDALTVGVWAYAPGQITVMVWTAAGAYAATQDGRTGLTPYRFDWPVPVSTVRRVVVTALDGRTTTGGACVAAGVAGDVPA